MTLYYAIRDPRTSWLVKLLAGMVVAYALSPIDLIPDFIPVLGLLDDLILLPIGIWCVRTLVPAQILEQAREQAQQQKSKPKNYWAATVIVLIWLSCALGCTIWLYQHYQ